MDVVCLTGASGSILGVRLIEELLNSGREVACVASSAAFRVMGHELFSGVSNPGSVGDVLKRRCFSFDKDKLKEYGQDDLFAPIASGSSRFESVTVIPCSMKTLSAVASGYADSLITRAADVALKEGRPCVLVPRETPLSLIHIENMERAARAGARIVIPAPGFYTFPRTIEDVIDFIVGKVLSLLGVSHNLYRKWDENGSDS